MFDFINIANAASIVKSTEDASPAINSGPTAVLNILDFIWGHIDNWITSIVILFLALYLAKVIRKIVVDKISDKVEDSQQDVIILAGRTTYATIITLGITISLKIAGIDLTSIIAAVGFGMGFAMQDLVTNFISGVLILLNHPFVIGDIIKVNGITGKVVEIQTRATILRALDGTKIVVPNSDLVNTQVQSFTSNPSRRIDVIASASYSTDIKKVITVCKAILANNRKVNQSPKPIVFFSEFGDSSLDVTMRFWVDRKNNPIKVKAKIREEILDAFNKANIDMPYNTQTLIIENSNKIKELEPKEEILTTKLELEAEKIENIQTNNENSTTDTQNLNENIKTEDPKIQKTEEPIINLESQVVSVNLQPTNIPQETPTVSNTILELQAQTPAYLKQDFVLPEIEQKPKDLRGDQFLNNIN